MEDLANIAGLEGDGVQHHHHYPLVVVWLCMCDVFGMSGNNAEHLVLIEVLLYIKQLNI